jgi:hypothetical protein
LRFRFVAGLSLFAFGVSLVAGNAQPPAVYHPLDALTPREHWTIYEALRGEGHEHEQKLFASDLRDETRQTTSLAVDSWQPYRKEGRSDAEGRWQVLCLRSGYRVASHTLKGEHAPLYGNRRATGRDAQT